MSKHYDPEEFKNMTTLNYVLVAIVLSTMTFLILWALVHFVWNFVVADVTPLTTMSWWQSLLTTIAFVAIKIFEVKKLG
jgi:hypothetical protein